MSKIIPFDKSNEDENCECPTCNLIEMATEILTNADLDEYENILAAIIFEAKKIGKIEYLFNELENKESYLQYLIEGDTDDGDLN